VTTMPLRELLPIGPGTAQWPVWGTTARLVVTDPDQLVLGSSC
jgi:thiamine biosynthesis lipoprotein